ncbi:hypothetical protein Btru_031600 [Bulinus truncatus]|nr:hypothetical protein Btru_031600 [Bulinus truncatus]
MRTTTITTTKTTKNYNNNKNNDNNNRDNDKNNNDNVNKNNVENNNNDNDNNNNDNVNKNNVDNNNNDNVNKNNVDNNNNDNKPEMAIANRYIDRHFFFYLVQTDKVASSTTHVHTMCTKKTTPRSVIPSSAIGGNPADGFVPSEVNRLLNYTSFSETTTSIDRSGERQKMDIKREVAFGIVQSLSVFWKSEELQDFTVTVGSTHFVCHKFLLAACSGFFQGLFRSQMKENICKCATLEGITRDTFALIVETLYTGHGVLTNDNVIDIWHAANQLQIQFLIEECETFINRSLSLNNCEQYLCHAKLLNRKDVLATIWNFIKRNFDSFSQTDSLLDVSISELLDLVKCQDLKVKSEDVVVESVLRWIDNDPSSQYVQDGQSFGERSISDISNVEKKVKPESKTNGDLQIVTQIQYSASHSFPNDPNSGDDANMSSKIEEEHQNEENVITERPGADSLQKSDKGVQTANQPDILTNDSSKKRSDYLVTLLSTARMCLVSTECLEKTMKLPMILENTKARDLILKALFYRIHQSHRHGQWPLSAIWRNCAQLENVAVSCVNDYSNRLTGLTAFSFTKNKWFKLNSCPDDNYYSICINVDNKLNLFNVNNSKRRLHWYTLNTSSFSSASIVDSFPCTSFLAEVIDDNVYIMTFTNPQLFSLNTSAKQLLKINTEIEPNSCLQHMTTFSNYLLIFYSESINTDRKETVVQCFDTLTQTVNRLNNLEGPAEKMTSFKNDHDTFILQANGDLWKVVQPQSDVIDFELVAKLWTCDWPLKGAVTFFDDLYIFGVKSESLQNDWCLKRNLLGYFPQIHYVEHPDDYYSALVPTVVNRDMLIPK